ncbi:MAG: T9SS type A sorting domain-containing protein, partial [Dinghuibacter sp.]|nr:T9SS type A sorting domain-containing protein [Dinghuibacter sp.]
QTWKGLPVNKNAEITIHINKNNLVDFVMNGFRYGITLENTTPAITPAAARAAVVQHLGITGNIGFENNSLMVLRHAETDHLVHRVHIETDMPVGEWEAFVHAQTGALLKVEDISAYHRHRHKPAPGPIKPQKNNWWFLNPFAVQVNGSGNVFDPDPLTTATAAYGGSYVDGSDANAAVLTAQLKNVVLPDITLNAGVYSLVGPYAEIRDFEAPSKGLFTQASSTFNFDRNADGFEAVNTYYHVDAMMRYLNVTLGLAIMPYQYAGGVRFDPSGLSGADNSHYLGGSGQIAFGEGGVDDAEDADVIIHELGHGLHDWVTAGGLSQVNGLSEGTGDYIAGSYSRFKGYWTSAQTAYNWTFNWDGHNPFWGGRVLNYAPVYPGGLVSQIHTDGQIWATANMKIWNDIGRQKTDKVFWAGLGNTNGSSNQNDAANAVYQAASALGYTNTERLAIHTRYTAAGYTLPTFVVPVRLVRFDARRENEYTRVNWTTANEQRSNFYTVERSANGVTFTGIGNIPAAGNSATERQYQFTDHTPLPGKNFYRLKETALDGTPTYSAIVLVNFSEKAIATILPNPVTETLSISTSVTAGTLFVYNSSGSQVYSQPFKRDALGNGRLQVPVKQWPAGVYQVKLVAGSETWAGKMIKAE